MLSGTGYKDSEGKLNNSTGEHMEKKLRIFREVEPVVAQTSGDKCGCECGCTRERLEYEESCAKCLRGSHAQQQAQVIPLVPAP